MPSATALTPREISGLRGDLVGIAAIPRSLPTVLSSFSPFVCGIEIHYRVTNVVGDTVFVDFSMRIASLALPGGDFIY